jgi:uncharacterized membrane protein
VCLLDEMARVMILNCTVTDAIAVVVIAIVVVAVVSKCVATVMIVVIIMFFSNYILTGTTMSLHYLLTIVES